MILDAGGAKLFRNRGIADLIAAVEKILDADIDTGPVYSCRPP
jgi:hypothetical protein